MIKDMKDEIEVFFNVFSRFMYKNAVNKTFIQELKSRINNDDIIISFCVFLEKASLNELKVIHL